jgi:hypothetical protein
MAPGAAEVILKHFLVFVFTWTEDFRCIAPEQKTFWVLPVEYAGQKEVGG